MTTINQDTAARMARAKGGRKSAGERYRDWSRVAFIVHSFNRASNIDQLVSGLGRIRHHELIVCEDGSLDGSREQWMGHLIRPNDFLILSNDLHEIRILDRAIRFARADIVCLVQDDDRIPRETLWLDSALERFERHPKLAIIGGFMGFYGFDRDPGNVRRIWAKLPFQFVDHVNIGPYFIRRKHYLELGGWDFSFSRVGEPGICFDNELCLRAWVNGCQVGYSFVPFKGRPGFYSRDGGTVLFSPKIRRRNQLQNGKKIFECYGAHSNRIASLVEQANRSLRRGCS